MESNKLGEVPSLEDVANMTMAQIPTGHYSLSEYNLPLSADELRGFGTDINPLNVTTATATAGQATSFIQSTTSPDWFMLLSIGVVVVPDAKAFALNGASIARPASTAGVPAFNGVIPAAGIGGDATARYAQAEWGHATWQAAWAFLQAYRLQMYLTGKFQLFDELAAHVGACVAGSQVHGLGNPNIAAARYIRAINDRQAALATGRMFIPQTVITGGGASGADIAAPPPLVPVGYGGADMAGIFGGWYPTRGILLYPGMPLQIKFTRQDNDTIYYNRMVQNLGPESEITWDANMTDVVAGGLGFSSSVPFKGGAFKVGVLLRGVSLAPSACMQWYANAGNVYNADVARQVYAAGMGALQSKAGEAGLAGLPDITGGAQALAALGGLPERGGSVNLPTPGLDEAPARGA